MGIRRIDFLCFALIFLPTVACGQIGDGPNEVQIPIVSADRIPPAPALSPEEALKSFTLAPGIKLEIAAAEPLVQEPVAIAFWTGRPNVGRRDARLHARPRRHGGGCTGRPGVRAQRSRR